jgi:molybdopterin/thiamine biosynthesis adenylyltransferase
MKRHGRQVRLVEVGDAGQARIANASVEIRLDGGAADAAARYLAGAGVSRICVRDAGLADVIRAIDPAVQVVVDERLAPEAAVAVIPLRDPAARDLARGALFALGALRDALDGTAP